MADKTKIEWCDSTWSPVTGCSHVSEGCRNCYAERIDRRQMMRGRKDGFREWTAPNAEYNVRLHPERLEWPLRWKKPRRVFVCSMADLFHEQVPDEYIAAVFGVMAACPQHTFQILTKREERMSDWILAEDEHDFIQSFFNLCPTSEEYGCGSAFEADVWPLPNVWLGISAEDQKTFDKRVPLLLQTPAAVRFVSLEPMLGPVDLQNVKTPHYTRKLDALTGYYDNSPYDEGIEAHLDHVIVGGESGPGARPIHPDWVRSIRDQCVGAGVPFFFKQWGQYQDGSATKNNNVVVLSDGRFFSDDEFWKLSGTPQMEEIMALKPTMMSSVGKKAAGRELDGKVWDQFPEVR